ncbi:Ig-like domain-containing protein [Aeromicrobium sp. Leaf350]|uniref:Ig-like domain-containing protein n=1 Tax=Aeromicrobium sp. Leaf350 TaxID=2876565 RepID=UPI001E42A37B|nr:Ig-like domain-containing protein [Aeromicrobium sp. Leaf350]
MNTGDGVDLSLVLTDGEIPTTVNRVAFSLGTQNTTVEGGAIPGHTTGATIASTNFVVPANADGTVIEARADSRYYEYLGTTATCTTAPGEGIVGLYVNAAPTTVDDTDATTRDEPITIDVLANDDATWDSGVIASVRPTPAELATQDDLTEVPIANRGTAVAIATAPTNGDAVLENDGTVTYTPDTGFVGTDSLEYTLTDNDGATSTASVSIDVDLPAAVTLLVTASAPSVDQGGAVTLTASTLDADGEPIENVTDDVVFTSNVATDVVVGNQVTFPTASPHTITGTHPVTGLTGSVVIQVIPPAAGPGAAAPPAGPAAQVDRGGLLPGTGGPGLIGLLGGAALVMAGATAFVVGRSRRNARTA